MLRFSASLPICLVSQGMAMCILSHFSRVWLCMTLWTMTQQAPLSTGFSRQEYWSGLPCPPPGHLPNLGIECMSLMSPALAARSFTTSATWEVQGMALLGVIMEMEQGCQERIWRSCSFVISRMFAWDPCWRYTMWLTSSPPIFLSKWSNLNNVTSACSARWLEDMEKDEVRTARASLLSCPFTSIDNDSWNASDAFLPHPHL